MDRSIERANDRATQIKRRIDQYSTTQHSTAQHNTAQHDTAQHSTAQHSIAHDSTAQHNTTQYSTAQPGFLKKHPLSPLLFLTHSMKCKSVSVLLKLRFVEKLLVQKQDSLCMIRACELFWLIHILSCTGFHGARTACERLSVGYETYMS